MSLQRNIFSDLPPLSGSWHTRAGNFRAIRRFESQYLDSTRDVLVYLPPEYAQDRFHRYPVLYLNDGQNVFDAATSFGGVEWGVDDTAEYLIRNHQLAPLIIVGVYNAGEARIDEYTPSRDAQMNRGGKAGSYGQMLVNELKPMIDREFRTKTGPASTGLGGSSLGGLLSMYLGTVYPDVFGKLAVLSPSVWWNRRSIIRRVESIASKYRQRIWLDVGTAEGSSETLNGARMLRDSLVQKGWREGDDLYYYEADGAGHNEAAWASRVGPMLRFLFA